MKVKVSSEIAVLQEIASAVVRERNVRKLLEGVSPRMMNYRINRAGIK